MFSFIRKFLENHRRKVAERELLCEELFKRVTRVLVDYIDVDHGNKESVQKWLADSEYLLGELNDISTFRRSSNYSLLNRQKKAFEKSREDAVVTIRVLIARENKKRADAEYVSRKLNQWALENKRQKIEASESKGLNRKFEKLAERSDTASYEDNACSCCGKDGKRKMLYSTEGEALLVAEKRSKFIGMPLRVYQCPNGCGYHITSNLN